MEVDEPQPEPGTAVGPQPGAEEIDMSLDDIIKLHRKEQTEASDLGDRRRQQVKNRNSPYGYGRPRFRAWMQRNLQGPNRFRRGFGQQQYNRRQFKNNMPGPQRRAAAPLKGVSPLNRPASSQEGNEKDAFTKSSNRGQLEGQRQPPPGPRRFRAAGASTHTPGRRPFLLNRGPAFQQKRMMQQRFSKANFQRGQVDANGEGRPLRMRRSRSKRPFLRSQRPPPRATKPQPKGVMLRFNFRAMANQTSLTLDERFSGLRNRRRFTAARSARRTVTMP